MHHLTRRIVRLRHDGLRLALLLLLAPLLLIGFAIGLTFHQPHRFFARRPWAFCLASWSAAASGAFVGLPMPR